MNVKTSKGTSLPLLNLKGKHYLTVPYRLVWFREDHPDWTIETEYIEIGPDHAVARAVIKDEKGRVINTGHKREDKLHFNDYLEKCETSAVGRALAMCGYGTQFTDDLEEGERLADAPIENHARGSTIAQDAKKQQTYTPTPGRLSEAQIKRAYAIGNKFGWTKEDVHNALISVGCSSWEAMTKEQYIKLCDDILVKPPYGDMP